MSPIFDVLSYVFGGFHVSTWHVLIGLVPRVPSDMETYLDR
jgi:hypothetical protein